MPKPGAPGGPAIEREKQGGHLEAALPGLYASPPEPLPFGHALVIRSFLLQSSRGNLLLYSVKGLESSAPGIEELGGIARHYLNHRHEAAFASPWMEAPLYVHRNERESVAKSYRVAGTFSERHMVDEDFEVIPTPGHTSGATAYLWDNGSHRYLFTGDTVCLNGDDWIAAVLASSDRVSYVESLNLIRGLDFDVLVPWLATRDGPYYALTGKTDARRRIDAIMDRVRRGGDH
jgi:Metallo-beta-lactamase superfamily